MARIALTQGKFAKVDDADFEYLNQWSWHFAAKRNGTGYAKRMSPYTEGKRVAIWMHREINQTPIGYETDHINHDTLDNRRSNLRATTTSQNQWNRKLNKNSSTGLMGVSYRAVRDSYQASIASNGKKKFLGYFRTAREAHAAYLAAKEVLHG